MIDYQNFYNWLDKQGQTDWRSRLQSQISLQLAADRHGKMRMWQQTLDELPLITPSAIELEKRVEIGRAADLGDFEKSDFVDLLKRFHPWRKGPYRLFGIDIDTEWHSDWKWDRVRPHITPLEGRKVLDVGGGNGYHGWRMVGDEAEMVVGIDPTLVFTLQYQVMQRYIQSDSHYVVPIGIEYLPEELGFFDTVFSMGVLYHRRSPLDHLMELRACLKPKGELVLETLVVDGEAGATLMPEQRYAKMRNVWFIPSVATTELWLHRCGFKNIRCVDVNVTSLDEQRSTEWMTFESLVNFLDAGDRTKTVEGYPAPKRAVFIAEVP